MKEYIDELKEVLDRLNLGKIREATAEIKRTLGNRGIVLTCGNGGSATTASHFVCDLIKNVRPVIAAVCLNDNIAALTAYGNDLGYEYIFNVHLGMWANKVGESSVLVAISTSGESDNVGLAARAAHSYDIPVIALTGNDGGELGRLADIEIRVPSDRIQIIEDVHLSICHMIAVGLGA